MRYLVAPVAKAPSRFPKPGRELSLFSQLGSTHDADGNALWEWCEAGPFGLAWVFDDARDLTGLTGVTALPTGFDPLTTRWRDLSAAERSDLTAAYAELPDTTRVPLQTNANTTLAEVMLALVGNRNQPVYDAPTDTFSYTGDQWPQQRTLPWQMAGAAFPTTGVIDSFTRANASPDYWGGNYADLWTPGGQPETLSNQGKNTGAGAFAEVYYTVVTDYGPPQEVFLKWPTVTAAAYQGAVWAMCHGTIPDSYNAYFADIYTSGGASPKISRLDNGSATVLGQGSIDFAAGDIVGMQLGGSSGRIDGWQYDADGAPVKWYLRVNVRDTTYNVKGRIGWTVNPTATRIDDFGGGTISEPVVPAWDHKTRRGNGNDRWYS